MTTYYVFSENGNFRFETTDEAKASEWCDNHNGYYCTDEEV